MVMSSKIRPGVKSILRLNVGLRSGETLLVITDTPTAQEWRSQDPEKLEDMVQRNLLARTIADIARTDFPESNVTFQTYSSVGRHSAEPGRDIGEQMKESDVVLAVTIYSVSYTDARVSATEAGARIASMPTVLAEMFHPRGSLDVDYRRIESETLALAKTLAEISRVRIQTRAGTDLKLNLGGRQVQADTGLLTEPGSWGNLPAGEAYTAPLEGTAEGILMVERGWFPGLKSKMKLIFEAGQLIEIFGGGEVGDRLQELLRPLEDREPYVLRRNLAEFGIGTNPNARRRDNILEAEKIRGTVHIAVGNNYHMGGRVKADLHQDFIIPFPTVEVDGNVLMAQARLRTIRKVRLR
jgi:leucyl aminopeptidase (aminopeptidase T)